MTGLLLAMALAAAPGCPTALAGAGALADPELAGEAAALVQALEASGAGGPVEALREEAAVARDADASSRGPAGARFRAALLRQCALASQAALPAASPDDRARAAEILERPEFRLARADPEAIRRWVLGVWQRILDLLETGEAQRYAAFSRALFLLAVVAAALLGLLALRRPSSARQTAPPRRPDAGLAATDARLDGAEDAAARGEDARAVRLALLAALAALERAGSVPPGRALTNQELAEQLRDGEPARFEALRTLARLFDRTVYGGLPAGPSDAAVALGAARTLGAEARR